MATTPEERQIPQSGPLSSLTDDDDFSGEIQFLHYGGNRHLRKAFRIPIDLLHFNILNGRYATKFTLLQGANPGVNIDPTDSHWRNEILMMLNGTWDDPNNGSQYPKRTWTLSELGGGPGAARSGTNRHRA